MKKYLIISFLLIIAYVSNAQDEFTLVKTGDAAPDFTFETAPGKTMKLSDLKGKVVWINFFATWCKPCIQEHLKEITKWMDTKADGFTENLFRLDDDIARFFSPDDKDKIWRIILMILIQTEELFDPSGCGIFDWWIGNGTPP